VAALGAGRRRGILVRDPGALEKIKDLDTWVFDKTGTLTEGSFDLLEICSEEDEKETLKILAAVEISSSHFLAAAVLRKAREAGVEMETAPDFREYEGLGVKGTITGKTVGIGSRSFMAREGLSIPSPLSQKAAHFEESGKTVVFFGWEERSRGFGVFGDRLRPGVPETIRALRARGVATWLVSGDSEATTRRVAREAGIENHRGNASPKDKVELIGKLQAERGRVGMVGDGINDSGALARADVGFAFASGADLAREASDVTFLTPDPSRVLEARGLSLSASGIIRRNFFFAFVYNALAIPLAISGFLNPVVAVCAMFLSSLSVIGNALRIGKTDNRVNAA
jgi:Cu+-exporting ATPase